MARRQPVFDPKTDASPSVTCSTIATSLSQKGSHKVNEQNNESGTDIEIIDSENCSEKEDVGFKNINQGILEGISSIDKEQNNESDSDSDVEIIDSENYSAKGIVKNEISDAEQNDESDADVEIIDSENYSTKLNEESKNIKIEISQGILPLDAKQKDESDADVEIIDSEIFSVNEPKLSEISSSQDTKQNDVKFAAEVEIIDTEIINVLVIQSLTFVYVKETLLIKEFYDKYWETFKQNLFKSEYQLVTKTKDEFEKMKCNIKIEITGITEENEMKGYQMTFYDFPFQVIDNDVFFNVAKSKRSLHNVLTSNAAKALELYSETLDANSQVVYLDMNKTYKGGKVRLKKEASVNKSFITVKKVYARKYLQGHPYQSYIF